ncbi:MAG: iron hydrogenase, partial [Candidatus Pacebacteria bacterium]|nr:iron hydrogenase [Candidatus Paceibacterota bacterium]
MITAKTLVFKKERISTSVQFISLMAVVTLAPFFLQQAIVGPAVNATLFIAVVLLGARNAVLIGILPSLVALSTGLLPPVLAP